jgi:hypothetical protein
MREFVVRSPSELGAATSASGSGMVSDKAVRRVEAEPIVILVRRSYDHSVRGNATESSREGDPRVRRFRDDP